ncbi:phosphatidylethanolamine N-methyltransferase family protein [Sneathiella marina]|uniref:Phosphatidylethanolamine N-methyltransferase family protein n=1 Tax=Sneathiella marina TaxID=2950108 RepID=A0ABY4W9D8_9PROT|nr:PEMT/PEM2 methyltransferase family protein [Sneathiella marina]USG61256.1 phosphatidylethanolamine N-methyltransferase family protein [Sneathiella marina]
MMQNALLLLGLGIAAVTLAAILWSICFPAHRLWPPKRYTALTPIFVWVPTFSLFGVLIALGIWGWRTVALPDWLRFGVGVPLILIGSIVVWSEVLHFGIPQTGGAKGSLRTAGMYRYSRNPQYLADIAIVIGWIVLSSAFWVVLVGIGTIAVLIAAPFAEEPWLKNQYGANFEDYAARVRRFL